MLELRNIHKRFGDKQILSDFNLTIHEGKILAIVGPSGGGKTTLLRMLAGLEKIDSGEVFYNGESLALDELTKRQLLGFVFQDFQLFPHLSVLENLTISPVKMNDMPQVEADKKARALLERLGLSGHEDAFPYSLSGGQKQRVALARAMMIDPEIIGYDEANCYHPRFNLCGKRRGRIIDVWTKIGGRYEETKRNPRTFDACRDGGNESCRLYATRKQSKSR